MKNKKNGTERSKPVSLYGMKPDDALRKALSMPPPKKPKAKK